MPARPHLFRDRDAVLGTESHLIGGGVLQRQHEAEVTFAFQPDAQPGDHTAEDVYDSVDYWPPDDATTVLAAYQIDVGQCGIGLIESPWTGGLRGRAADEFAMAQIESAFAETLDQSRSAVLSAI